MVWTVDRIPHLKKISSLVILLIICNLLHAKAELYSRSFGNKNDQSIIFLHGGPGYNCASFEFSTAQKLADLGFYVIVYDRRGEGRSKDDKAKFNFKQTFKDLKSLYDKYDIQKPILIGHSFGGVLATRFAVENKKSVKSVVLVGAPVSLQESFETIINTSKQIYLENDDKTNLKYITMLEEMDSTSLDFAVYCFAHAMQNGFYSTSSPSDEAEAIYKALKKDSLAKKYISEMTQAATQGFWKNESYTTIDLKDDLRELVSDSISVYGLYGQEDGLYSSVQIEELKTLIGAENVSYLSNCSHSVFIDQQTIFLETFKLNHLK
ncbi:MAG: alpha/beta fold hydrolase [Crocinitomicaceae bacterium]